MNLDDQVASLLTEQDVAASRVGLLGVAPGRTGAAAAETLDLEPFVAQGQACELILADTRETPVGALAAAAQRLSRDGMLLASIPPSSIDQAARAVANSGVDWIAKTGHGCERFLVAGRDVHPEELGPTIADDLLAPINPACLNLPQNRADRARRRHVRRHGRDRMLALARRLEQQHGEAVGRVIYGVEILVAERPPLPEIRGRRPGMFSIPGLDAVPWPLRSERPNLDRVVAICARYGERVATELETFVASRSFAAYLADDYNKTKFRMDDPHCWQAIRLIDWRQSASALPASYSATRAMLTELGALVSGEVNVLRLPPRTALPPHYDDYDCEQYIHIGITVPDDCAIRVGGEDRRWQRGQPIVFSPAFLHEVWNKSDQPRDVIAIDTWHSDLSTVEVAAVVEVRNELEALRRQRRRDAA